LSYAGGGSGTKYFYEVIAVGGPMGRLVASGNSSVSKGVSSSHFNILMIWTHGGLRLTKGPVPGGRRASSVDFPVRHSLAAADALF
jgi:hypothetical protein